MKTIERYVFTSFLSSFVLAFLVLTFVVTIFLMVQIVGLILDGVSASLIGRFALVSFPETLQLTFPLALMVSSLLVFSRLSSDSEIAAMRACGVNLLAVIKWPVLFAFVCTLLGIWANQEITPRGHELRRRLKSRVTVGTGLEVLQSGLWIDDFPKVKFYFRRKEGNWLYDVHVKDFSSEKFIRTIQASKALVTSEGRDVTFDLYDMKVDPIDETRPGMARVMRYRYVMKDALKNSRYNKKTKDFRFRELLGEIDEKARDVRAMEKLVASSQSEAAASSAEADMRRASEKSLERARCKLSELRFEMSKRFVFPFASICLVLVGIPLGIRSQRKESYAGWLVSAGVTAMYYLTVMAGISLEKCHWLHPEYLIWLPVFVCFGLATHFIRKNL